MEYPTNLTPSFILRSRREVNTIDATNSRFVNYWQSGRRERDLSSMDMNPTSSRLYREDLNRSPPYVPSIINNSLDADIRGVLADLSKLKMQTQTPDVVLRIKEQSLLYNSLLIQKKNKETENLASNPYFNKYDIAGDSRNVIRELRGAVSEDVVDRGVAESQKLFQRSLESRWVQPPSEKGVDSISAFELLRPRFNQMEKMYNA